MAFGFNYNSLITEIAAECNRNDAVFLSQCPVFISLAEQMIFIDWTHLGSEIYATGNFTAMSGVVNKPSLWGDTLTFSYLDSEGNIQILERVAYEYCRKFINNPSRMNTLALPTYYTDYGYDRWLVVPTPQIAFDYEVAFVQKITPLSLTQQTSWLTTNAYDLLFIACVYYAYSYLSNERLTLDWDKKYKERVEQYNKYNKGRKADRLSDVLKD